MFSIMMNKKFLSQLFSVGTAFILLIFNSSGMLFAQQKSFHVEVSGTGRPIVLIPGYACTGDIWDETVGQLDPKCHVFSLPGFGGIPGINTDNYLSDVTSGIKKYIRENDLRNAILIGHSLGGLIALSIATDGELNLEKVVCIDAWPFTPAAIDPLASIESSKTMAQAYFKYDSIPLGITYSGTREQTKPYIQVLTKCSDKVEILLDMTMKSEDRICKQAMYEMFTTDLREELKKISVPVLILGTWFAYRTYGISAQSMTDAFEGQYKNLGKKEIFVHSDSRHFIMFDAPEWFSFHLLRFINK